MQGRFTHKLAAGALSVLLAVSLAACSSVAKPSKEDVSAALAKKMGTAATSEKGKKAVTCLVNELYDKLSAETLIALVKDDKSYKGTDAEATAINEASTKCTAEALK